MFAHPNAFSSHPHFARLVFLALKRLVLFMSFSVNILDDQTVYDRRQSTPLTSAVSPW